MRLFVFCLKCLIILGLFLLAEWSYSAFLGGDVRLRLHLFLILPALLALPEAAQWRRLPLNELALRLSLHGILVLIFALLIGDSFLLAAYIFYNLLLLFLSWMLRGGTKASLGNFAVSLVSTVFMLALIEFAAPSIQAWVIAQQQATNQAASATVPSWAAIELAPQERQSAGSPVTEVLEEGPGPSWGPLTGWGTRTNARVHRFLPNEFDVMLSYNSAGLRGGEIAYEKPDDLFRILLIGDSYIEAREVNDDETVYAQLNRLLADHKTPDGRRIEVIGAGATGWGTAQSYLYYHVEGYRFSPDLVMNVFIINDVADNYPALFYPERSIDFVVNDSVTIISSSESKPKTQAMVGWLNALPEFLQASRTIQLLRQVFFPPLTPLTLISNVPQSHPQDYIFLRQPALDGYPEAWDRTERIYQLWDAETEANGAQLMVLQVDIGVSYLRGVVDRHIDKPDWLWDMDLPTSQLERILNPLNVPLIGTRDYYEAYASGEGLLVHDALFLPTDGHWNPTGHLVTAQRLVDWFVEQGIVVEGS
jgi:hypothetical protein